ncbi:MAG: HAD family hydrolase [Candidatus Aminicenantes bacterium]|nr:MAG: HAD family hydrolase [Candidatus Aminicenantes bacterium]
MKKRAVFLDRDGTINRDVGFPSSYDLIEIYSYSFEAVRKIKEADMLAVITTNQSGIGRGLIQEKDLHLIHKKLKDTFAEHNIYFDGIYYCPHYLSSSIARYNKDCLCRKPNPGRAIQAAADLNIDMKKSYMVGDKVEDVLFGLNIQAKPILVLTGFGQKSLPILEEKGIKPAHVASTLLDAVNWILERERESIAPKIKG